MEHWIAKENADVALDGDYTELGWEVVVNRLKVIRMINEGKISKDDVIVTLKDRAFMYPFCKTRAYDSSFKYSDGALHPNMQAQWLKELHMDNENFVPWRWKEDIPLITSFDFSEVSPPPCVVINHRIRAWDSFRNCNEEDTRSLVSLVVSLGLKPYLSGRFAEKIDDRAEYIPSLRTLASIVNHNNCQAFFTSGGPTMLAQQCCKNKLICINTCGEGAYGLLLNHPLFMSSHLNFSGCVQYVIEPKDIKKAEKILKNEI